jgi:hypothetical protein
MANNQGKKYSTDQLKQREEVGLFIEKALGKGISEIVTEHFPTNRGTYYDNVVKIPLRGKFIKLIKEKIGVDLSIFNDAEPVNNINETGSDLWRDQYNNAMKKNEELWNENRQLKETIADKKKLIDHYERTIEKLNDEIKDLKKQA